MICKKNKDHEVDEWGCIDCFYDEMQKKQFEVWDKID